MYIYLKAISIFANGLAGAQTKDSDGQKNIADSHQKYGRQTPKRWCLSLLNGPIDSSYRNPRDPKYGFGNNRCVVRPHLKSP